MYTTQFPTAGWMTASGLASHLPTTMPMFLLYPQMGIPNRTRTGTQRRQCTEGRAEVRRRDLREWRDPTSSIAVFLRPADAMPMLPASRRTPSGARHWARTANGVGTGFGWWLRAAHPAGYPLSAPLPPLCRFHGAQHTSPLRLCPGSTDQGTPYGNSSQRLHLGLWARRSRHLCAPSPA